MLYSNTHNLQCDLQRGYSAGRYYFFFYKITIFITFVRVQQLSKCKCSSNLRISVTCLMTCWRCHSGQKITEQVSRDLKKIEKSS